MLHLRDAVLPVVLVLDGDMAIKLLADEFLEAAVDIADALAGDDDRGLVAKAKKAIVDSFEKDDNIFVNSRLVYVCK